MGAKEIQDPLIIQRLQSLGVTQASEWDTLTFVYRHAASLGTAAQIAQHIGYDKSEVGDALHSLEALRLIQRSRISQGIRMYQISEIADSSRLTSFLELMTLAKTRAGHGQILEHLKRSGPRLQRRTDSGLRLAKKDET